MAKIQFDSACHDTICEFCDELIERDSNMAVWGVEYNNTPELPTELLYAHWYCYLKHCRVRIPVLRLKS